MIEVTLSDGSPLIAAMARDAVFALGTEIGLTFEACEAHLFSE